MRNDNWDKEGVSVTERELVVRAKAGEESAFEQLVLNNQNRVYTLAVRMAGNPEEGADLAQEAFLKAWQGLSTFQGDSSFSTWVYRLTINVCLDYLRKRNRRREVEPTTSLDDESAWSEPSDPAQDPQRQLERAELRRAVTRGLEALPDHHRQILTLRELSGLSYQEIGALLELDIGTVKSRLARARLALQKILLADGNFFGYAPSNHPKKPKGSDPT
jgi:RNA polymerase sigma-70 factor (ECF subfamily)